MCECEVKRGAQCATCHRTKKPHGRSAPLVAANGYCDEECPGYYEPPYIGCLWPGESCVENGNCHVIAAAVEGGDRGE